MALDRDVLTTGEVAKLCNVAPRTVSKWFDSGQLKGYRIPGSKDRRIPMAELVRFMKAHGIPLDGISSGESRLLVIDGDPDVVQTLENVLNEHTSFEIRTATTAFEAGVEVERFRPDIVLADIHIGGDEGREIAGTLQASDATQTAKIYAMSGRLTEGQAAGLRSVGFDGFLKKPFAVRRVLELLGVPVRNAA